MWYLTKRLIWLQPSRTRPPPPPRLFAFLLRLSFVSLSVILLSHHPPPFSSSSFHSLAHPFFFIFLHQPPSSFLPHTLTRLVSSSRLRLLLHPLFFLHPGFYVSTSLFLFLVPPSLPPSFVSFSICQSALEQSCWRCLSACYSRSTPTSSRLLLTLPESIVQPASHRLPAPWTKKFLYSTCGSCHRRTIYSVVKSIFRRKKKKFFAAPSHMVFWDLCWNKEPLKRVWNVSNQQNWMIFFGAT